MITNTLFYHYLLIYMINIWSWLPKADYFIQVNGVSDCFYLGNIFFNVICFATYSQITR